MIWIKNWFNKNGFITNKSKSIFILSYIGYDTRKISQDKKLFNRLIKVYKLHFMQNQVSNKLDIKTINFMIKHFLNLVLTKNKKDIKRV